MLGWDRAETRAELRNVRGSKWKGERWHFRRGVPSNVCGLRLAAPQLQPQRPDVDPQGLERSEACAQIDDNDWLNEHILSRLSSACRAAYDRIIPGRPRLPGSCLHPSSEPSLEGDSPLRTTSRDHGVHRRGII